VCSYSCWCRAREQRCTHARNTAANTETGVLGTTADRLATETALAGSIDVCRSLAPLGRARATVYVDGATTESPRILICRVWASWALEMARCRIEPVIFCLL
jgi:hypothetical protein